MSNKDQVIKLLEEMPDHKIGYVLAYVRRLSSLDDDNFCAQLTQEYLDDSDPDKQDTVTLGELARDLGTA